ncbi:hypothetical protein [Leuconostoc pseudomesenteroides]|uniref:hypothetical protein n=1 Tax=Leuconostoc pseudomesenteroides TaxID=33968 RepID=UPI004035C9FF
MLKINILIAVLIIALISLASETWLPQYWQLITIVSVLFSLAIVYYLNRSDDG